MATRTKKGAAPVAPDPKPVFEDAVETPTVAPPPDPYAVRVAKDDFARLDDRERAARAANCLLHGHPTAESVHTALGAFCPHCCAYLGDE